MCYSLTAILSLQETVPSSGVSNGSGELAETLRLGSDTVDDGEDHTVPHQRTKEARDHIAAKIQKTKDLIKEEQKARDGECVVF